MIQIIGVIATKNRNELLKRALMSAINQTRKLDELIVVSDSDERDFQKDRNLCESKCIFLRDRYIRNYAGNLNTAIDNIVLRHLIRNDENADDIYIAFLDDDDSWKSNYIESCCLKLSSKPDFVVSGLNYSSEGKAFPLSVPTYLEKTSFLAKNPHIQGSNTFIKLSTLLKAGCFDEALNSTTDRDFFTRVMMLNPKYEIINETLVDIDAHNDRSRLTNNNAGKRESLSYFYSKYEGLMDSEIKLQFFERANRYTELSEESTTDNLPHESVKTCIRQNCGGFNKHVVFGFIVSDEKLGLRLLKAISDLEGIDKSIVLLCNIEYPTQQFIDVVKKNNAKIVLLREAKKTGLNIDCLSFASDSLRKDGQIKDITISRTILHKFLKTYSNEDDIIWVLDDDMDFKYLTRVDSEFCECPLNVVDILSRYDGKADVVIGSYSGDAPLPTLSTLRTSLLDYVYKVYLNKTERYRSDIYDIRDYYYDLSDSHIGLETPLKSYAESLNDVFSGKATSRKLFVSEMSEFTPYCRGGNTIIFNRRVLDIPNISPRFGDLIARRSDYFWVEQVKKNGFNIIGSSFATLHSKIKTDFEIEKEADKLLKDLLGSSFTKTIESELHESRESFYKTFKQIYEERLTRIYDSFCRITGLLSIADADSYKGMNQGFINRFIKKAKYYLYEPMVRSAYDVVRNIVKKCELTGKKEKIISVFGEEYKPLGYGQEGVALLKGDSTIVKVFYEPQNFEFLKAHSTNFNKCEQLNRIYFEDIHGYSVLSYSQNGEIEPYEKGHAKELVSLLCFLKDEGLTLSNVKKDNFILLNGKLKFIDYGKNIIKFTETDFDRTVKRTFEMLKYPAVIHNEFTELIEKDYMGDDAELLFGIDKFIKLFGKREKEAIHDGMVIERIKKYSPKTILDYGAGKCKIMNRLKDDADCYVFDVDTETLHSRADRGVTIIDSIDAFNKQVDLVISNLVLCNVTEEWTDKILANITKILKSNGHAILSICDPFFDSINNTELRSKGYSGEYKENTFYTKIGLYGPKEDYHRPFSYYENLLKRHGLEIVEVLETEGVNADTLNPIGEHLVFDVVNRGMHSLTECTLMIKTCPMDYEIVIPCIKQIIHNLEKGCRFKTRLVSVDLFDGERNRRYSNDDKSMLLENLQYLKDNGMIDEVVLSDSHAVYTEWFGENSEHSHSENGQQLLATLNGFENVDTQYVFQTDIDILYKSSFGALEKAFEDFVSSKAITGAIGVYRQESLYPSLGNRTEVRTCFIDLIALKKKLPIKNYKNDNGQFVLPWHRALDNALQKNESIRFAQKDLCFVHLPNSMKKHNFISAYLLGNIPEEQKENVDAVGNIKLWYPKAQRDIVVFSRGKNVGVEKLKRLIGSLKNQSCQDFDFVYFDDCSDFKEQEYLYCLSKYDLWCKNHMILIENIHSVDSLANFDTAMKFIVTDPNTIVINVDGDDALLTSDAIAIIQESYKNGADMTVGGCFRADKPTRRYSIDSFKKSWERNGDNIWLHPKTFKRYLVDYIGDFLQEKGKYLDVHTDYAILLPIVEASKHPIEIKKKIYYFEPSLENKTEQAQYETQHKKEILEKLFQKAKRRFMKPIISVIGDAAINSDDPEYFLAEEVGKQLVDAGYRVQTGGLGGVMEAALKGAKKSNKYEYGDTLAILPGNDTSEANEFADIRIATGLDSMRAKQVVDAYAVIAIGGGAGTLAEIATAWSMYKLIIAWNKNGWSAKLANKKVDERQRYGDSRDDKVYSFESANEAIELISELGSKYQKEYKGIKWRKSK